MSFIYFPSGTEKEIQPDLLENVVFLVQNANGKLY